MEIPCDVVSGKVAELLSLGHFRVVVDIEKDCRSSYSIV